MLVTVIGVATTPLDFRSPPSFELEDTFTVLFPVSNEFLMKTEQLREKMKMPDSFLHAPFSFEKHDSARLRFAAFLKYGRINASNPVINCR